MSSPDMTARSTRTIRLWRTIFIIYALVLTVATHWPRLQLPPETPASDKTIHVVAFAVLTLLLSQTRWIASWWIVGAVAMVWAALDEATQALPGVFRHASREDFLANAVGVLMATVLIFLARKMYPVQFMLV